MKKGKENNQEWIGLTFTTSLRTRVLRWSDLLEILPGTSRPNKEEEGGMIMMMMMEWLTDNGLKDDDDDDGLKTPCKKPSSVTLPVNVPNLIFLVRNE